MTELGIDHQLRKLRDKFRSNLDCRLNEIKLNLAAVQTASNSTIRKQALAELHRIVHLLAGSGRSFGFAEISEAASPLDAILHGIGQQPGRLTRKDIAQIGVLVERLESASHLAQAAADTVE